MSKYIFLIFSVILFIGCRKQKESQLTEDYIGPDGVVNVDAACKDAKKDILTPEEAASG